MNWKPDKRNKEVQAENKGGATLLMYATLTRDREAATAVACRNGRIFMHIECKQLKLNKDGRIACTIVVENHSSDADTIKQVSLTRRIMKSCLVGAEPEAEDNTSCFESIAVADVALPPGAKWEETFTWNKDASDKVKQLGEAMVLVVFAKAKPAGSAFTLADVQGGKIAVGNLRENVQRIGWPVVIFALLVGIVSMKRLYSHHQEQGETSSAFENLYSAPPYPDGSANSVQAMVWRRLYHQYVTDDMDAESKAAAVQRLRAVINATSRQVESQSSDQQEAVSAATGSQPSDTPTGEGNSGSTPLITASYHGRIALVKQLLDEGADVKEKTDKGWTALIYASMNGDMNTVKRLLNQGIDVNAKDEGGSTALMYASWRGYVEIVKRLLDNDADVNAQDSHGMTALGHASQEGHADIVKLLIDNGADVNAKDEDGMTILIYASQKGKRHDETVKLLLDKGADVNAKNKYGATALIYASRAGAIEKVKLLLAKGADADAVDKNGMTALMYASQAGHADIVNLLQK